MADHPTPEQLSELLLGKLSVEGGIADHVDACSTCQEVLETLASDDSFTAALVQCQIATPCNEVSLVCEQALQGLERATECMSGTFIDAAGASDQIELPDRLGSYQIIGKIAAGGMGSVYKVRHARLDRIFALKVLRVERSHVPQAAERFEREWRAVGRITHPNVVQATDANEHDGLHFLVMEYVDGWDFSRLMNKRPLPSPADVCELVRQSALGLHAAHLAGLVHRDVKPSNLMLTRSGHVKVLDLGVALLTGTDPNGSELTAHGQILGTVEYMSPEQVDHSHKVDRRSDIYSLGCTFYALLTGVPPFSSRKHASIREILNAHVSDVPAPMSAHRQDVPAAIEDVLFRMMDKRPEARPTDMQQVCDLLAPWSAGHNLERLAVQLANADAEALENSSSSPAATPSAGPVTTVNQAQSERAAASSVVVPHLHPDADAAEFARHDARSESNGEGTVVTAAPRATRSDPPRKRRMAIAAAAALFGLLAVVIIVIKSKDGEQVLVVEGNPRIEVDARRDPVRVTVEPGGAADPPTTGDADLPSLPIAVQGSLADQLTEEFEPVVTKPGEPLSPAALVTEPIPLDGVRAWTLETRAHRGPIKVCRMNPSGTALATGGADASIRIWSIPDGALLSILLGHDCPVESLEWSRDGSVILSAGGNEVCFWAVEKSRLLQRRLVDTAPTARSESIRATWGSEERDVIVYRSNGKLQFDSVLNGTTSREIETTRYWSGMREPLAWDAGRTWVATCSQREPVRLWETKSGRLLQELKHNLNLRAVAISPDGDVVAAAGVRKNGAIAMWDARTGEARLTDSPIVHSHDVDSLSFSPDGTRLAAAGGGHGNVSLWDVASGQPMGGFKSPHQGITALCWSNDQQLLLTAGHGSATAITLFDGATGQQRGSFSEGYSTCLTGADWHPAEPLIAVGIRNLADGTATSPAHGLMLCNLESDVAADPRFISNGPNTVPEWSTDGFWVLDGWSQTWDLQGERSASLPVDKQQYGSTSEGIHRAWSPDGHILAIALSRRSDNRGVVQIRRMPSGEIIREITSLNAAGLDLSPTGTEIAIAGVDSQDDTFKLQVFDVGTGEVLRSREVQRHQTIGRSCVRWSPDGAQIAVDDAWLIRLFAADTLDPHPISYFEHQAGGAGSLHEMEWLDSQHLAGPARSLLQIWIIPESVQSVDDARNPTISMRSRQWEYADISPSPDGRFVTSAPLGPPAALQEPRIAIWDWSAQRVVATLVFPSGEASFPVLIDAKGNHRSLGAGDGPELLAVIETDKGQSWLPLDQFASMHHWTNRPEEMVRFAD